jgi:hypothetical protein
MTAAVKPLITPFTSKLNSAGPNGIPNDSRL